MTARLALHVILFIIRNPWLNAGWALAGSQNYIEALQQHVSGNKIVELVAWQDETILQSTKRAIP
jgi:hypothetical protein